MIVSTQYKWNTFVKGRMIRTLALQLAHFMLAAGTFVFATRIIVRRGAIELTMPDVLHGALLISNTRCLWTELRQIQLARQYKAIGYLTTETTATVWNLMDLGGIVAVYVACAGHFLIEADPPEAYTVQQAAAVAILLNSFSLLQVLRPFDGTVSLSASVYAHPTTRTTMSGATL